MIVNILLTGVCGSRVQIRHNWFRDRSVSIPPYLRPIEEELNNDDDNQLQESPLVTSAAGAREVITLGPIAREETRDDVTEAASHDRRRPISQRAANDVHTSCENCDPLCRPNSCEATQPQINEGSTRRAVYLEGFFRDYVIAESHTSNMRLFYFTLASFIACVAFVTSLSPSFIVVAPTVLIVHYLIRS